MLPPLKIVITIQQKNSINDQCMILKSQGDKVLFRKWRKYMQLRKTTCIKEKNILILQRWQKL